MMIRYRNRKTGQVQPVIEGSRLHLLVEQSEWYELIEEAPGGTRNSGGRRSGTRKKPDTSGDDAGSDAS